MNLRLAFRTLFRTPFVTLVAVLSLALGIGANAAIFSLFDQMLLRPLPVPEPERLVNLSAPGPKPGSQSCNQAGDCDVVFSYPTFRDLQRAQSPFSGIAAHRLFGANIAYQGQTVNGQGVEVSGSYFPVLGLRPALGRLLTPQDDRNVGGEYVAVLSYSYWDSRLGANPHVLNTPIVVNGQSLTIVGVAPRGFEGTTLGAQPMLYVPITMRAVLEPYAKGFDTQRRSYWAYVFGRLKPGVTIDQARAGINAAYRPIINDVEAPLQEGMSAQTMAKFRTKEITLEDGRRGQSSVHKEARTPLTLLFSITGIVLLIACANIANLLLARAAGRSMEMAIRLSLGAARRQLLAQLLTESVLLAVLGGAASLLVAHWTLGLMASLLPADAAGVFTFALQPSVLVFAALVSIGTGIAFGLFPALHSTSPDLISTLRAGSGKHSGVRAATRFRTSLVTAQIALSMALLIAAGLFIKSLRNVSREDLGIRTENVVMFGISPRLNGYTPARSQALFAQVHDQLAALPGVSGVSAATVPLLAGDNWTNDVSVQGFKKGPDTDANSHANEVAPEYFSVLGVPLLAGREFTLADGPGAPKVAIVNEAFAKKFNLGRDVVGKLMGTGRTDSLNIQIVGLVRDAKYSQVRDKAPPVYFTPLRQDTTVGSATFYVHTSLGSDQLVRAVPRIIRQLDANLPVEDLKTLPQQVKENVFLERMISTLSAGFAALATLLAAVGLYGVLAYTVAQRTKEIGVRMALGADARRVQLMVMRQVGLMTLVGGIIGIAAALAIGRAAASLLFELQGNDPFVMLSAAVVLVIVAFGAGYVPAVRASRVDPMNALRYE